MGRVERIQTLNPKRLDGKSAMLRDWRKELPRKEIRQLSDQGAILYYQGGKVVESISLQGLRFKGAQNKEELNQWRDELAERVIAEKLVEGIGGEWQALWLEPLRRSSNQAGYRGRLWSEEASDEREVSKQQIGGYSSKYRHSKHRQVVNHSLKRLKNKINQDLRGE